MFDKNWFMSIRHIQNANITIICFPYGGGGASAFWSWRKLGIQSDIYALKLPGRESRIAEDPICSRTQLIDLIVDALPSTWVHPIVFYGHSMGAGIAFQTILELKKRHRQVPYLLIASGREPPHYEPKNPVYDLDDEQLIVYLQKLGGIRDNIPKDSDFINQYIPKIRADYQLNSSLSIKASIQLPLHISIINGADDRLINLDTLQEWEMYTTYRLDSTLMSGGHFFIAEYFDKFITVIEQHILTTLATYA